MSKRPKTPARRNLARSASAKSPPRTHQGNWWVQLSRIQRQVYGALLLAVVTLAVYSPVRKHSFINYDDGDYVIRNSHIHSGLTLESLKWAVTTTAQGNWHPVTWISHAIDCQLFGLDATGHHLTNLILHIFNAVLLFFLLASATGSTGRALVVAALFALHPINVESVAWVAERKNVLSTLFFLLSLGAYGRYAHQPNLSRYLVLLATFSLALASKPMVVTFPFALLVLDYWPLRRVKGWATAGTPCPSPQISFHRCALEKVPLLVLSMASCVITLIAQRASGAVKAFDDFPLRIRLTNAAFSYVMYLWKAIWPAHLSVFYPHPGDSLRGWQVGLSVAFLLVTSWLVWRARFHAAYLIAGWLWFLGTLVPVIGVIQVGEQAMADRYAYIPLLGIFVAATWGIADLCELCRIPTRWVEVAALGVLAAFSYGAWRQIGYWRDSHALWWHALAVTRDNPQAETQAGMALIALDRQDEAMARFQRAIALGTHDATSYLNLGAYLSEHGQQREAIPVFETALQMQGDPESRGLTYLNLGFAYTSIGDYQSARACYSKSLQIDPELVAGTIRGLAQFATAHPSAKDYMKLALLLDEAGRSPEAAMAFEKVLRIDPNLQAARTALGTLRSLHR